MSVAFPIGLSIDDDDVSILTRSHKDYDVNGSTDKAVVVGISRTRGPVTSAALILLLAFGSLASGPETTITIVATGLAAGTLLDATVLRGLLVPPLTMLFGRWIWWLPRMPAGVPRMEPSLPTGAESVAGDR